ncbi:hypothetical protein GGU10DRAFT_336376 [Lentinula aff. detonsa]|uniref:Uncharacterized protein n=1 Tax=Lentinula aff. detonsa TaxID=2804958 RepID=A0AA38KLV4_9AGAR|nr:hypothetical protein GGU10DRAFT_336376 [Lentinula aff. detonsa]
MSITPTTFFAPIDFPELTLNWDEQRFEILGANDATPFVITIAEMIKTIQSSLALGRGWKVSVNQRYPEIARTINHIIPDGSETYLSSIENGTLRRSQSIVTYEHFFTPTQLAILQDDDKITNNLNRDVARAFPKPPRVGKERQASGSMTGAMIANFTKSDMDQSILFAGLMAHARETERKKLWRLRKGERKQRSTRGAERFTLAESRAQSSTMGLNAKILKWRLNREDDEMDTVSGTAGPSNLDTEHDLSTA